jgi:hypothetical protein
MLSEPLNSSAKPANKEVPVTHSPSRGSVGPCFAPPRVSGMAATFLNGAATAAHHRVSTAALPDSHSVASHRSHRDRNKLSG